MQQQPPPQLLLLLLHHLQSLLVVQVHHHRPLQAAWSQLTACGWHSLSARTWCGPKALPRRISLQPSRLVQASQLLCALLQQW